MSIKQISVFLENRPGKLKEMTSAIENQIKEYQSILENANQEYIAIEEEIESLVKMCNKRYDEYLPINLLI